MLAFRLAEHVVGTVHVDEMLESMSPELFDEWAAKDEVEPIGYTTQTTAMILHLIHAYLTSDTQDVSAFMPWLKHAVQNGCDNRRAQQVLKQIAGGMR